MTNPGSAMALATEINNYLNPLYNIGREQLAAIIRKHQAQEIGELVERLQISVADITTLLSLDGVKLEAAVVAKVKEESAKAESLLSRYPKV